LHESDWHYAPVSVQKPREIAVHVLLRHEAGEGRVESLLDDALAPAAAPLSPQDRALAQELVFGVVRRRATLDWLIARRTDGRTQKAGLQVLLRLGLYQLFWLDRIPDHAAVHETVALAKRHDFGPQAGFVNAVLRACLRERPAIEHELEDLKRTAPHLGHSHPEWLCTRWEKAWGREPLLRLLEWNNTPPALYLRANTLKTTAAGLVSRLANELVPSTLRRFDWIPGDLMVEPKSLPALNSLACFRDGLFYVQDPSTLLAVQLLDPRPGETILDACAAPGGKTTAIADAMQNRGTIVAEDTDATRLPLVAENCARLGVTCVQAGSPALSHFDRVLVDAPCFNTGVLRRRVDLRWRVTPAELQRLAALQRSLLRRAADRLKPGGALVYSTCSLEPEENRAVVDAFLAAQPGFTLEIDRLLTPFTDGVDGAYAARLRKT
jgi:16S rRNA (cytosine967-C5)-methyltransferase